MHVHILFILCLLNFYGLSQSARLDEAKKSYESRKYPDVIKLLEAVRNGEKDYAGARYYLGRVSFDQKRYDDAQDFFEEAIEANDKVAEYHNWLGNTYGQIAQEANIIKQGMLASKMKAEWERAVALNPAYIDPRQSLIQYYLQAPGIMGGSVDKAKETARQIMALNAAQGHLQMGNIYVKEKKLGEAEKEFIEMVKVDPAYLSGLANFYTGQKQYDKAFTLFEEAVQKNSRDMGAVYQFGKTSAVSGQKLDRGEECLKKYLTYTPKQNEPSHAGANMRLAQINEKKGNKVEAKKFYEAALRLDGSLKEAREGLQRISK